MAFDLAALATAVANVLVGEGFERVILTEAPEDSATTTDLPTFALGDPARRPPSGLNSTGQFSEYRWPLRFGSKVLPGDPEDGDQKARVIFAAVDAITAKSNWPAGVWLVEVEQARDPRRTGEGNSRTLVMEFLVRAQVGEAF